MKVTAKLVKQGEVTLYETSLPVETLTDEELVTVDRWAPEGGTGYQREVNLTHVREIARYLAGDEGTNVLPTSVIINSREGFTVTPVAGHKDLVEIDLKSFPIYITDGQHRVAAARLLQNRESDEDISGYEMAVTLTNFSLPDEIAHFRKINTRANKAPKGLDQQLRATLATEYGYSRTSEESGEDRAVDIVTRLATDTDSVWFDRVALGGHRKRFDHTTNQSALVASIRTMFIRGRFANVEEDMNEVYRIFFDWWQALAEAFPEAAENPAKYNLQRQTGFHSMHEVLNRVFSLALHPTREQMDKALEEMRDKLKMNSEFWQINRGRARSISQQYGTKQSYQLLADDMWYALPKDVFRNADRPLTGPKVI